MPKGGGGTKFWGSFHTEVLAILKRGAKGFHTLEGRGAQNVLPCLEGGTQKVSDPRFSHFVAPPPLLVMTSFKLNFKNTVVSQTRPKLWADACCGQILLGIK